MVLDETALLYRPLGRESCQFLLEALERPRGECYHPSSDTRLTGIAKAKGSNDRRKALKSLKDFGEKFCTTISMSLRDQEHKSGRQLIRVIKFKTSLVATISNVLAVV